MKGYLHLTLEVKITEKAFQTYSIDDQTFCIKQDVLIFPQSYDLIKNYEDEIKGFIYVTSIITAAFMNTSVPIGFAFGFMKRRRYHISSTKN